MFMTVDEVVRRIRKFYLTQKRLPSYSELSLVLDLKSKKNSFRWAQKLIEAGILGKDEKGKLFPKGLFQIPQLGIIKAGYPTTADALVDDSIDLYNYILDMPGQIFSLIVKGDSMIDEGIQDGDIAIIEKGRQTHNGDIVAACVDNEWTLKTFMKRDGQVLLVPANEKYPVIRPKHSLMIGGVVISVIRKYH
jgi:SOS regulatory protein LexA